MRVLADAVIANARREARGRALFDLIQQRLQRLDSWAVGMPGSARAGVLYRFLVLKYLTQDRLIQIALSDSEIPTTDRIAALETLLHEANTSLGRLARIAGRDFQAPIADVSRMTVEDLWACSESYVEDLSRRAPRTLAHATALFCRGHLAVECAQAGSVPIIDGYYSALDFLDRAARCLVAALGVTADGLEGEIVTLSVVDELAAEAELSIEESARYFGLLSKIFSSMGRAQTRTGDFTAAHATLTDGRTLAKRQRDSQACIYLQIELAMNELHVDTTAAIERLTNVLTEAMPRAFRSANPGFRRRICAGMAELALLLREQGATAAKQFWVDTARSLLPGSRSAHDRLILKRLDAAAQVTSGLDRYYAAPSRRGNVRHRVSAGNVPDDATGPSRSSFYICRDLTTSLYWQNVPVLVENLTRLAGLLVTRRLKDPHPLLPGEIAQAVAAVNAWRPHRRASFVDQSLPGSWLTDLPAEARLVALIAREFAEPYCPADGLRALRLLAASEALLHGDSHERTQQAWVLMADRATALRQWRLAVDAELKLAWSHLTEGNEDPDRAIEAARRARQHLLAGLQSLRHLYDVTSLLDTDVQAYPARIARVLTRAEPASSEAFAALALGKGLALAALRSVNSEPNRALIALQQEEERLKRQKAASTTASMADTTDDGADAGMADGVRGGSGELGELDGDLQRVRTEIAALARTATPIGVQGVRRQDLVTMLRRLGKDSAVIQIGHSRDDVVLSAVRLATGGDRPVYLNMEICSMARMKTLRRSMWRAISMDLTKNPDPGMPDARPLRTAYQLLVEPLLEFLEGVRDWHIVAQGELASVPLHAALIPDGRYLVEDVSIGYAPSLQALGFKAGSEAPEALGRGALLLGFPDGVGGLHEIAEIRADVADTYQDLVVAADSEDAVRLLTERSKRWSVAHVVAHGESLPFPDTLDSTMQLGDAVISAAQVLAGNCSADLVFINACHLALSGPFAGDLYGFPFAFLASGSGAVIAAAAPVFRPYASEFAVTLHRAIAAGTGPFNAFNDTVRHQIQDPWTSHPVYWAPYFFIGDPLAGGQADAASDVSSGEDRGRR
jgi:CHAT domain-containing protein